MVIKYSVIVPVYNAQKTLDRCISSLISEERDDVEIIMVDDGSTDASGEVCDKFALRYSQCQVIHKKNGGVSAARNTGLDHAQGKYVLFTDSDDYVEEHYFSLMDNIVDGDACDYYIFSYQQVKNQSKKVIRRKTFVSASETELYGKIRELISNKSINAPWAKAYRKDLIEQYHIRFPEGIYIGEDTIFNIAYSMHISSLCIGDAVVYSLDVENENSLSRSYHADLKEQFAKLEEETQKLYLTSGLEEWKLQYYRDAVLYKKFHAVYSESKRMHLSHVPFFQRYRYIYEECSKLRGKKAWHPDSRFCRFMFFTIRHRMVILIDIAGAYLANKG